MHWGEACAHCQASIEAAMKDVREKCLGMLTLLALRTTGGVLRPTSVLLVSLLVLKTAYSAYSLPRSCNKSL